MDLLIQIFLFVWFLHGSGNDFIRSIYENPKDYKNFREYIKKCIYGYNIPIDAISSDNRYAINICSVGLDALIAHNVDKFKKIPFLPGPVAYMLSIFYTILFAKLNENYDIFIDEKKCTDKALLVAIANGKYYGGGICPAPNATPNDGILDVCVAYTNPKNKIKILTNLLPKYKAGKHLDLNGVSYIRGNKVEVSSNVDMCTNFDGEIIWQKKIEFEIIANGLIYRKF